MTLRRSNARFLDILPGSPIERTGWEVVVRSYQDFQTVVAYVVGWETLGWTQALNEAGTGTIAMNIDGESFQAVPDAESLIESPHLWQFYYDGVLRHEWFAEKVELSDLKEEEVRRLVVGGPGSAAVLREAVVLPPSFPTVPPFYWTFTDATQASRFLAWLAAAKSRGMCAEVSPTFTATADGAGAAWTDKSSTQEENGASLYDHLVRIGDLLQADFVMKPGFRLDMRLDYGHHREQEVVFFPLSGQLSRSSTRDRENIKNVIVAQDAYGKVSVQTEPGSVAQWRRREAWVSAGNALDDSSRSQVASAVLAQLKEEAREWTFSVDPAVPFKVFVDYDLGDWISMDLDPVMFSDVSGRLVTRIVAMAGTVEPDAGFKLELTLETLRQNKLAELEKAIAKLGGGQTGTVTAATPISVAVAAAAAVGLARLADLADVEDGAPADGDTVVYDSASGVWQTVPPRSGFRGAWSAAESYVQGSIVSHSGLLYAAVSSVAAGGAAPPANASWVLFTAVAGGSHGSLTGRDAADSHPVGAVTGLQAALDAKASSAYVNARTPPILVLGKTDPLPGGTAVGTVIVRKDV